jgi:hypothetical protein
VIVGDIAVPNQLELVEDGRIALVRATRFWDGFITTAPVPSVVVSDSTLEVTLPWTRLSETIVTRVAQYDSTTARAFEEWMKFGAGPAEWGLSRLRTFEPSDTSAYHRITGINCIVALNLFDFVKDLGDQYGSMLRDAVSSAVKETLEKCGSFHVDRLAIPALAGAEHVNEKNLVLSYAVAFEGILDGVGRATTGDTPAGVCLVVWLEPALAGHPEYGAAMDGVERAAYKKVPLWGNAVNRMTSAFVAIGFVIGLLIKHIRRPRRLPIGPLSMRLLAVVPLVAGQWYLQATLKILPISQWPPVEIAIIAGAAYTIGMILEGNLLSSGRSEGRGSARKRLRDNQAITPE